MIPPLSASSDATKVFGGGANRFGFPGIRRAVLPLIPAPASGLGQHRILDTLRANWYNGTDLASQKAIAKSLVKLSLDPGNAATVASAVGVGSTELTTIATNMAAATPLTPPQSDFFSRFDLMLTAILDQAYQHAGQVYRNGTRALATLFAIILALAASVNALQAAKKK